MLKYKCSTFICNMASKNYNKQDNILLSQLAGMFWYVSVYGTAAAEWSMLLVN